MKSEFNRILVIVMEDGEKHVYTIPTDRDPQETFNSIVLNREIDGSKIKSNYYFAATPYGAYDFQNFFNEETEEIDGKSLAISYKLEEFKKQRSSFFNSLDLEFMKSIEEDCAECKSHVVKIKNYLRTAPEAIGQYCHDNFEIEDIVRFNCFNNVFDVHIINGGKGYESPPTVTIDKPNDPATTGFEAKAMATIKDGKVKDIIMTQIGSGYIKVPQVKVSLPEDENGEIAILTCHGPENNITKIV
jgi:hypothetical protein